MVYNQSSLPHASYHYHVLIENREDSKGRDYR